MEKEATDLKSAIGLVLRYGVVISFAIVAFGSILLFVEGQTGYGPIQSTQSLVGARDTSLVGLAPLLQGVLSARPYAIIDLGLLVLLATPVARVAISIPLFAVERRFAFVAITAAVLGILLFSIFVVAPLVVG